MANLFWYDVENGVLQCIQSVTVGGAFERSIPYAEFILSKGQDYFIAFGTESLNGRVIHTDGRFPAIPLTETSLLSNFPKDVQVLRVMTS